MKDRSSKVFNHTSSAQTSAIDSSFEISTTFPHTEAIRWHSTSYYSHQKGGGKNTDVKTQTLSGLHTPLVNCSIEAGLTYGPVFHGQYSPAKKPRKSAPHQDLKDASTSVLENILEQPLSTKQRALYKPRRYRHNSGSGLPPKRLLPRRSLPAKTLDTLFSSLNLNELTLSAVHVAMGSDGSAQSISPEKEKYYRTIFKKLDVDNDGKVDVAELKKAYKTMGLLQVPGQAEKFVTASDSNKDGELDVAEFIRYLHEHEMKLKLMFKRIDRDKDGKISTHEMIQALRSVGLTISNEEANSIMKRIDKDGTSSIDLDEWVAHHLLHPSADIKDILFYWKHATESEFSCHIYCGIMLTDPWKHREVREMGWARYIWSKILPSESKVVPSDPKDYKKHPPYMDIGENLLVPDDFTEDEKLSGRWWRLLVSGGAAGAVSRTSTAPLDRLKVLMQVHATKANNLGIKSGWQALLNEGGVRGLWRGNGINVLKIAPESALKFFAFERFKTLIGGSNKEEMGMRQRFVAGSLAGAFSQTCIYPMEVIKTRLALRKTGQYKGIFDCALKIYANEGPGAFFKGYVPNLLGILPYAGIDLCIYETLKNYWVKHHSPDTNVPSVPLLLACGTMSSTCGQLASYPLALIRTKMQASKAAVSSKDKPTMLPLVKSIYRNEGLTGFYRGIGPNFLKVAPAVSISYVVYEKMKLQLRV